MEIELFAGLIPQKKYPSLKDILISSFRCVSTCDTVDRQNKYQDIIQNCF
jgi:hypothetical protein